MTTITLEMPESLAEQLAQLGDRLPEILMVGLREAPLYQRISIPAF